MSSTFLYKAQGDHGKYGIFLTPSDGPRTPPVAILPNGQKIQGRYINTNEGRHQFTFGTELFGFDNVQISVNGQAVTINPKLSYEGTSPGNMQYRHKGDLGGAVAGGMGGAAGGFRAFPGPGGLAPSAFGAGALPGYLGGEFPSFSPVPFTPVSYFPSKYKPIGYSPIGANPISDQLPAPYREAQKPDYQLVDPATYAKEYSDINRNEYLKNFQVSKKLALDTLDTELQGLKGFSPAASALSRELTSADNIFNQAQRTQQIKSVIPDVQRNLQAQTGRASTYASGRLVDEGQDRALELGIRSQSADLSSAAGFGAGSRQASKASDLMSAQERFKISQFGEELTGANAQSRAALELAPLEYAATGNQIRVTPSFSPGQVQLQQTSGLTDITTINPTNALGNIVQQKQFGTGVQGDFSKFNTTNRINNDQFNTNLKYNTDIYNSQERTGVNKFNSSNTLQTAQFNAGSTLQNNQFNSANRLQADQFNSSGAMASGQFNSTGQYSADLNQFNYDAGFSQAGADLGTAEINNSRFDDQLAQYMQEYNDAKHTAQTTGNWEAGFGALGSILHGIGSLLGGGGGILSAIGL